MGPSRAPPPCSRMYRSIVRFSPRFAPYRGELVSRSVRRRPILTSAPIPSSMSPDPTLSLCRCHSWLELARRRGDMGDGTSRPSSELPERTLWCTLWTSESRPSFREIYDTRPLPQPFATEESHPHSVDRPVNCPRRGDEAGGAFDPTLGGSLDVFVFCVACESLEFELIWLGTTNCWVIVCFSQWH